MKPRILLASLAALSLVALSPGAEARPRHHHYAEAGELHPNLNPLGPGHYALNGHHVYAGPNCYVSREQVLVNGQLVWRPLSTCMGRER